MDRKGRSVRTESIMKAQTLMCPAIISNWKSIIFHQWIENPIFYISYFKTVGNREKRTFLNIFYYHLTVIGTCHTMLYARTDKHRMKMENTIVHNSRKSKMISSRLRSRNKIVCCASYCGRNPIGYYHPTARRSTSN